MSMSEAEGNKLSYVNMQKLQLPRPEELVNSDDFNYDEDHKMTKNAMLNGMVYSIIDNKI